MHEIVRIEGDDLVIRLDVAVLCSATECCPTLCTFNDETGNFRRPVITNIGLWREAIARSLRSESEDGTTLVHRMFDQAFLNATEAGEEGMDILP